jgi:hypothetical protein
MTENFEYITRSHQKTLNYKIHGGSNRNETDTVVTLNENDEKGVLIQCMHSIENERYSKSYCRKRS